MNKKKIAFWIILGLVVVGVVLSILFVTLFGNKTTKSLAENINRYTTGEGYLNSLSERNKKINKYLNDTVGLYTGEEAFEVSNYKATYNTYIIVANFFEKEIAFMEYNNTYKSKKGEVENNLSGAQNALDKMIEIIDQNQNLISGNPNLEKIVWNDNKDLVKEFVEKTVNAFNVLSDIYTDCVKSMILNNDYSKADFIGLKNLSENILKNTKENGVGQKLATFVSDKFGEEGENKIIEYAFNANNNDKISDVVKNGNKSVYYDNFVNNIF